MFSVNVEGQGSHASEDYLKAAAKMIIIKGPLNQRALFIIDGLGCLGKKVLQLSDVERASLKDQQSNVLSQFKKESAPFLILLTDCQTNKTTDQSCLYFKGLMDKVACIISCSPN